MSAHTTPEQQRIISEQRTKKEIENLLDACRKLEEAIEEWEKKLAVAKAELTQLLARDLAAAPLSVDGAIERYSLLNANGEALAAKITTAKRLLAITETLIQELEEQQPAIFRAVEQRKQRQSEETFLKAIEGIAKEVEKSREPTGDRLECGRDLGFERSVAASFYLVDAILPDTYTLPAMRAGFQIAFHFWIGTEKDKIRSNSQEAYITKPAGLTYPITFQVTVWSDHFKFANCNQEIILPATGSSNHARFIIDKLPAVTGPAEIFTFLRHKGELVGAFRVTALVTEKPEEFQQAQIIEDIYLHGSWFRFQDGTSRSALTILITKKQGTLQIFTLDATGHPWAPAGFNETGIYERSKEIYRELHNLANRAEKAIINKEEFKFRKEAKRLASLGYPLFVEIFYSGTAGNFAEKYAQHLGEGSTLTVAIGREAENLYIPWGLLYDQEPQAGFSDFSRVPKLAGFWGYKYNLIVRHSVEYYGVSANRQLPLRIGAAWLEHKETDLLRETFEQYEKNNKITIKSIPTIDHSLPTLAEQEFDLIQFFCHGHTKLLGVSTIQETVTRDDLSNTKAALVQASYELNDSLLELSGGLVTLSKLKVLLKNRLPGHPIVLLSMCESAQVSASGTGFVPLFLSKGARAVIGTEGPTLWTLSREMDTTIVKRLLEGRTISQAFYETRKELAKKHVLALIYTLYGDADARFDLSPTLNSKNRSRKRCQRM